MSKITNFEQNIKEIYNQNNNRTSSANSLQSSLNSVFNEESISPSILPHQVQPKKELNIIDILREFSTKNEPNFDIDGDGKLNEQEKAAALAYHEQKLTEETRDKFDFDGDGKLNEQEKAAYDAYVNGSGETTTADKNNVEEPSLNNGFKGVNKPATSDEGQVSEMMKEVTEKIKSNKTDEVAEVNVLPNQERITELKNILAEHEKTLQADMERLEHLQNELANTPKIRVRKRKQLAEEIKICENNIKSIENAIQGIKSELARLQQ